MLQPSRLASLASGHNVLHNQCVTQLTILLIMFTSYGELILADIRFQLDGTYTVHDSLDLWANQVTWSQVFASFGTFSRSLWCSDSLTAEQIADGITASTGQDIRVLLMDEITLSFMSQTWSSDPHGEEKKQTSHFRMDMTRRLIAPVIWSINSRRTLAYPGWADSKGVVIANSLCSLTAWLVYSKQHFRFAVFILFYLRILFCISILKILFIEEY